ncbi:MAG: terpene cyclase/mutase family protein [Planctomycetia bacterium]|nr:terpene cyclase/mutase family protein [Planctomycetia bacterium]
MKFPRRLIPVLFACLAGIAPAYAETFFVPPETDAAIARGLDYFRKRLDAGQPLGDGAFRNNPAVTALVGMAFLSSGSTPLDGPDAAYVQICLDRLLAQSQPGGVIAPTGLSGQPLMYGHGFAVLFLAECYGMSPQDEKIRPVLDAAVSVILQAQNPRGGWRYTLRPFEEDVSVTSCMTVALRACRNAGIEVPSEAMEKALAYLKTCQNPDGGFRYREMAGPSAWPRTAAVLAALCSAGVYDEDEIAQGLRYLNATSAELRPDDGYYPYAVYYAAQAYWLCDLPEFPWKSWYTQTSRVLAERQKPNGSWSSAVSTDYATAMTLIVLQVPNNSLPIFQR